jgi:glycosyltransferase involved in cell wall biosynthesis
MTERSAPHVCLCVPTYRRPNGLRNLLAHIEQLTYSGPITIVVVDNDAETRAGIAIVEQMSKTFRFPLTAIVEPRRGHTYASNCAFVNACRVTPAPDYVAVLDDDEYPEPDWLDEMIRIALKYNVDLVGGPVFPVFDAPDHWLAKSGIYAPTRFATGRVPMIYGSGNMLIQRSTLEQYLDEPFLNDFALTGGGDEEFFWRCRREGRSFAWADEARVYETTPRSRTTVGYMLLRRFRAGTGATRVERKFAGTIAGAPQRWFKGLGLLSVGILFLPLAALRGRCAVMRSLIRAARGAGRIAAEFGILYEEYR